MKRIIFTLTISLLFATSASATVVPVFDWVAARTDSLIGLISGSAQVYNAAVSSDDGSVYFSHFFTGTPDFDPGAGTDSIASLGGQDGALSKFSSDGTYQWTKTWGSASDDFIRSMGLDGDNNILVSGTFASTVDFDPGAGTTNKTSNGGRDVAVLKLDSAGEFQWVQTWGGTGNESSPMGVAGDASGNVYVSGTFTGTVDFDPGAGTAFATSSGSNDSYVVKYDSAGTFQWVKKWGGTGDDSISRIFVADDGSLFLSGVFTGTADFDPGAGTVSTASAGSYDAFLLKLDSSGTYQWRATWGGTGLEGATGVAVDSDGNIYASGYFSGTADFDPGAGTTNLVSAGGVDAFLLKLDSSGAYVWAKRWGGSGSDASYPVVFSGDTVVVPGYFSSTVDFDPGAGSDSLTSAGGLDVFLSTFDTDGEHVGVRKFGGTLDDWVDGLVRGTNPTEGAFAFFGFHKSAPTDFDPSAESTTASSNGTSLYLISFNLIEPAVAVTTSDTTLTEGALDSSTYTLVLSAPPTEDVVLTITPDADLSVSTTSILFSTTTWSVAQTITVTPVEDAEDEGTHTGTIMHTTTSSEAAFDGLTVNSVTMSITDDDAPSGGGGSSGHRSNPARKIEEHTATTPSPAEPAIENSPELVIQLQTKIAELKQQLIVLLTQKIKELQAQISAMQ